jgi:hypothetical protein
VLRLSKPHPGALHQDNYRKEKTPKDIHEGEEFKKNISSICTQICGTTMGTSKSYAKIVPARVYHENSNHRSRMVCALIDDQNNATLASSSLLDAFNQNALDHEYMCRVVAIAKVKRPRPEITY